MSSGAKRERGGAGVGGPSSSSKKDGSKVCLCVCVWGGFVFFAYKAFVYCFVLFVLGMGGRIGSEDGG